MKCHMSDGDGSRRASEVLRKAARGGQERFLIGLDDAAERQRIAAALVSEGFVQEVGSISEALGRLADESFDLAILEIPDDLALTDRAYQRDPLAASRELRPFSDVVLITDSDPVRCGEAFGREVAAVLPRPLPEVDALLRAHVKRLAGFRRARTRGQLVLNAFAGVRDELRAADVDLAETLEALAAASQAEPTILVLGDADLARAAGAGGHPGTSPADAVVV